MNRQGFSLIDVLIVVAAMGIIAAVAIPAVQRSRVATNESETIGDVRTVISAQAAYQAANGGWYEYNFDCLAVKGGCIPSAPVTSPTFLDSQLAALTPKSGYGRGTPSFGPGPAPPDPTVSATSVSGYTYIATPMSQGVTGVRGFGGDGTGIVCYSQTGAQPPATSGQLQPDPVYCIALK